MSKNRDLSKMPCSVSDAPPSTDDHHWRNKQEFRALEHQYQCRADYDFAREFEQAIDAIVKDNQTLREVSKHDLKIGIGTYRDKD